MPDNPYEALLQEDEHQTAQANLNGAHGVSPSTAASAFNDAPLSNVPPSVGMQAPDEGALLAAQRRESALLASSPPLQTFAAKSAAHVAATRDDWGNLSALGDLMDAWTDRFRGTKAAAAAVGEQFTQGGADFFAAPKFAGKLFDLAAAAGQDIVPPLRFLNRAIAAGSRAMAAGLADVAGDFSIPNREQRIADIQNKFGMALWALAPEAKGPAIAGEAAAAGRTAGGAPHVGPEGPTFTLDNFVADAKGNPASFPDRSSAANFLRTHSTARGGPLNVADYSPFYNGDEGVYHVVRSVPKAAPGVSPQDTPIYTARAGADAANVEKMEEAVAASATHTRTPGLMEEFLTGTPAGQESVFVDSKAIATVYAQGHNPFPAMGAEITDALASGRDVEVPMSTYLTEVSGQPYAEALRKATRFTPDGVSVEEARTLPKAGEEVVAPTAPVEPMSEPTALPARAQSAVDQVFAEMTLSKLTDAKALGLTQAQFERYNAGVEDARTAVRDRTLAKIEKMSRQDDIQPEEIVALAREAMIGPEVESLLIGQLRDFAEASGSRIDKEALQLVAKQTIGRMPVRQAANLREAERAFKKTSRDVEDALLKGNVVKAFAEKQRQVLAWYQLEQAHKLVRQVARANRDFSRLARKKVSKGLAQPFLDQLHRYLPQYGFPTKRNPLELAEALNGLPLDEFVDTVIASNAAFPGVPDVPPQKTGDMSVQDFRAFSGFVYAMRRYGREVKSLQAQGETTQRQAIVDELVAGAPVKGPPPPNTPVPMTPRLTKWNKAMALKRGYDAIHRKPYDMLAYFDNGREGGVMERVVEFPLEASSDKESLLERETYAPVIDAFNRIPSARRGTYGTGVVAEHPFTMPDGSVPSLTPGDVLGMALYVGEESALAKLAEGFSSTPQDVLEFLDANLTAEEREFVQAVWDGFGKLAPEVSKELRADTGTGLERLPLRPWVTPTGTFPGGYIPLRYNRKWDLAAAQRELERGLQVGLDPVGQYFSEVVPGHGFTEERTKYAAPLDVSLSRISTIFDTHIKYAAWSRNIKSVRRFVNDPTVRALVESKMGPEYWNDLNPWLDSLVLHVSPTDPAGKWVTHFANELRMNFSVAVLGLSYTTGISQISGMPNAIGVVGDNVVDGTVRMGRAIAQFYRMEARSPGSGVEFIQSRSEMMAKRVRGRQDANLSDALDRLRRNPFDPSHPLERIYDRYKEFALAYIGFVEAYTVAYPAWLAGYTKALESGADETRAVRMGNRAVEQSQGSGRKEQLAAVQRDKGLLSLMYAFETPFNAMYQRLFDASRAAGRGDYNKAFNLFLLTFIIAPLMNAMLGRQGPKDAEPSTVAEWGFENFAMNLTRPMLGIGALVNTLGFNFKPEHGKFVPMFHSAKDLNFSANVATRAVSDLAVAIDAGLKIAQGRRVERPVASVVKGAEITGFPGVTQIARTGEYLHELSTGEQQLGGEGLTPALQFLAGVTSGPQPDQANKALIQRLRAQSHRRTGRGALRGSIR